MTNTPALTPDQARRVQHAREIAAATAQTLAAQIGIGPGDTADQMYGYSFGLAQVTIGELLQVIEQLTGADDENQDDDPESRCSTCDEPYGGKSPGCEEHTEWRLETGGRP